MPSLQVSLADITNPHNIPNPRSLNQIPETSEATSFDLKLKLPLTLVHPNSPYVPWDPPVRQKILCTPATQEQRQGRNAETSVATRKGAAVDEDKENTSDGEDRSRAQEEGYQRDKKPGLANVWHALKAAPRKVKIKCRMLLNPGRGRGLGDEVHATADVLEEDEEDDEDGQIASYGTHAQFTGVPLSPTASYLSTETHSLSIWLSERQRKFLEKDCESAKLMGIEEYERMGSWIKPGDLSFAGSRTSYACSFVSEHGDSMSGVLTVFESDGDLALSVPTSPTADTNQWTPSSPSLRTSPAASRAGFSGKRVLDEERLSRIVHRASMLSYMAERPFSTNSGVLSP